MVGLRGSLIERVTASRLDTRHAAVTGKLSPAILDKGRAKIAVDPVRVQPMNAAEPVHRDKLALGDLQKALR